jgi:hypothetical protein
VCEHCREAICKTCRASHFKDFNDDIHVKVKKLTKDSDLVLFKESKLASLGIVTLKKKRKFSVFPFTIKVEAISNHEKNLQTCLKTKDTIQKKISDIIRKLKEDEKKLLDEINEFEQSETALMNDNSDRVQELNEINLLKRLQNTKKVVQLYD